MDLVAVWDYGIRDERREAEKAPIRSLFQVAGVPEQRPYSVQEAAIEAALEGTYSAARRFARRGHFSSYEHLHDSNCEAACRLAG